MIFYVSYIFFKFRSVAIIKSTVKIRNILFATFSHTYPLHSLCSDVYIFRNLVPNFQYPHHRSQPPVLSANSSRWSAAHCAKMFSYDRSIRGKGWKSERAKSGRMIGGDQTLPIENTSADSLLQLQCAVGHCHEERQYPRRLFWIKESNYSMHFTFVGRLLF